MGSREREVGSSRSKCVLGQDSCARDFPWTLTDIDRRYATHETVDYRQPFHPGIRRPKRMRVAFIADGRSEHTQRWVRFLSQRGDAVLFLSTYPCEITLPNVMTRILPGVFRPGDVFVKAPDIKRPTWKSWIVGGIASLGLDRLIRPLWHHLTILDVPLQAFLARQILRRYQPEILHVMRIQNEGYVAALAGYEPWILSAWGSDLVFVARRSRLHRWLSKTIIRKPAAYTADCRRDIHLAHDLGLPRTTPTRVFPGNGGVCLDTFQPGLPAADRNHLILYPRGLDRFLKFDTLLLALQLLLRQGVLPNLEVILLGPSPLVSTMQRMVQAYALPPKAVTVRPFVSRERLAALLQHAAVMVSPSISDGTPNSLLEAMACGAFPVVSDIDSIREWIVDGENGLLFDPSDAQALADCLASALRNGDMRQTAQNVNLELIRERADYSKVMPQVAAFYEQIALERA